MIDRRALLLSYLRACRVEETEDLHNGRVTTPPPLEAYADKIESLYVSSLFRDVMTASTSYVKRFKGELTEDGTLMKFGEEVDEFYEAATNDTPIRNDHEAPARKRRMAEEAIDVMVTIGGVLAYYGVTFDDIEQAARDTLKKLTDRKEDQYVWDEVSKTVSKRSKLEAKS